MIVRQDIAVRADNETGTETLLPLRLRELILKETVKEILERIIAEW